MVDKKHVLGNFEAADLSPAEVADIFLVYDNIGIQDDKGPHFLGGAR